ncbi:MATE family efflux transporter [Pseudomonas guariconensis]|uniref:MATE family efflux transporter n=1 Tax=Pseudomonas guariconensis TaxID=1288410 RepID=UPI0023639035|nr:MATE family efflux transporter [Pseudomonas guariconensis]MDD2089278.1 MATE family efflux transporter [Pseudomonas guariconensis]
MHVAPTTELKALLRLAGPLIASQLAHMLMVLTDTLMMARISPQALAGGGLGAASYSFVSIFCLGVIAAVGTLVAIRQGAGDVPGATRLAQNGLWLAWGLALVAALVLWNLEPALLLFGQQPENVASAMEFLTLLPLALPGYLTFMALRGFTSALGRSTPVMVISLVGTVLNYVFNHALIEGMFGLPKLGLMGIGLVTAVVSMGLPIGGTYMVEVGLFAFAALCMGVLGSTELAAHQIALQIVSTAFMVPTGLSYAVTMRVGLYYGGGNLLAARSAGRVGIGFGAMIMFAFAALFWLLPDTLVGLFIDRDDPAFAAIFQLAVSLVMVAAWFELFDGMQTIAMGSIRGLKDAKTTFLIGLCCYWLVGAPSAWLFTFTLGGGAVGVWWGLALGLACAAVALTLGFEWRTKRMLGKAHKAETAPMSV